MCERNFVFADKKSKALPVPIITASINAEQDYVQMPYINFHPNRAIHVGSAGTGSVMLLCMKLNTPNKILWASPLLNSIQTGQKM